MVIEIEKYREYLICPQDLFYPQLVGVDLSLERVSKLDSGSSFIGVITKEKTIMTKPYKTVQPEMNFFNLDPGTYSFVFEQGVCLDSSHYAEIVPRSSLVRCGGVVGAGIYEPGYSVDQIGAVVHLTSKLSIEKGARVVQLKIYKGHEFGVYNGQWNNNDVK